MEMRRTKRWLSYSDRNSGGDRFRLPGIGSALFRAAGFFTAVGNGFSTIALKAPPVMAYAFSMPPHTRMVGAPACRSRAFLNR
jgi:hypothetical protein